MTSKKPQAASLPRDGGLDPVTDQLGPRLRAEFEQLQKSERKRLLPLPNQKQRSSSPQTRWRRSPP